MLTSRKTEPGDETKVVGLCHMCGKPAVNTCQMCGRQVCSDHYDSKHGMCQACKLGRRAGK